MEKNSASKSQNTGANILKWIGIATAIISLILGSNQIYKLIKENRESKARNEKISVLIKDSHSQAEANDFNGAWKTLEQAQELNSNSREVEKEQAQLAMKWIRTIYFKTTGSEKTFSEVVDRLTPILNHELNLSDTKQSADILAHIGWANFLKWNDGITGLKTDELFKQAIAKDSLSVYANSFYAFWLMKNENNLDEAKSHFKAALKSGIDKPFIRRMQVYAYNLYTTEKLQVEIILMVNEMRKNSETLSLSERQSITGMAYNFFRSELIDSIKAVLPADEHLATYNYLINQSDYARHPNLLLTQAILLENAGDYSKALDIYQSLKNEKYLSRMKEVEDGIKRIKGKGK